MCGRFTLTADLQKIAERFGVPTASPDAYTAATLHGRPTPSPSGGGERQGREQARGYRGKNTPTERRGYTNSAGGRSGYSGWGKRRRRERASQRRGYTGNNAARLDT